MKTPHTPTPRPTTRRRPARALGALAVAGLIAVPSVALASGASHPTHLAGVPDHRGTHRGVTARRTAAPAAQMLAGASLVSGTAWLAGTDPSCVAVTAGTEYRCELATPPVPYRGTDGTDNKLAPGQHDTTSGIAPGAFQGTVEVTAHAGHVNGGARALNANGSSWEVYLGSAAVRHGTISASLLGQPSAGPSVG